MSTPSAPPLRGETVVLRPAAEADADRLTEILQHPGVAAWWHGYDQARVRREMTGPGREEDGTVVFAVEAGGRVIGLIQYAEEDEPDYRHAAIDVSLHPDWHGRGLGAD